MRAGYKTALAGKWHLGSGEGQRPFDRGFDEFYGLMDKAALRGTGIDDHTVVMFLSDNGGCSEEPGGRDASQRPGIKGTYTAEFSGERTEPVEGLSILPVLVGKERVGHERIFWEWGENKAVMEGRWKLVWDMLETPKRWQLFDIEEDRTEMRDLAPVMQAEVERMKAAFDAWALETRR